MKLEYLVAEHFPDFDLKIRRSNFGVKDCKFRIFRDQDFRLCFEIRFYGEETLHAVRNFLNRKSRYSLIAVTDSGGSRVFVQNLLIASQGHKGGRFFLKGEAVKAIYYFASRKRHLPSFKDYYFLNNLGSFIYPRSLEYKITESVSFELTGFSSQTHDFRGPFTSSNSLLVLSYESKDILVGAVESKKGESSFPSLFIRTRIEENISDSTITQIQEYLAFIGSGRLIPIGNALITTEFLKIRNVYHSTFSTGISSQIFCERHEPIKSNMPPFSFQNIEAAIQKGFDAFIKKYLEFRLDRVVNLIMAAHIAPFELKIQPLAAAYDTLKSRWFRSKYSRSKGKKLQDADFHPLIEKYLSQIGSELGEGKPTTTPILNRIRKANEIVGSERDSIFFAELGLDIGDIEKFALNSRNSVVHGNAGIPDFVKISDANTAYFTLINRIMLRMLDFEVYFDHTYPSGHHQPPINQKMLGPKMNGKPR